jgi:hypothetical protein
MWAGSALAQSPVVPSEISPSASLNSEGPSLDREDLVASRQASINRVRATLVVEQKAITAEQCSAEINQTMRDNALQVFVENSNAQAHLAPLTYDLSYRQTVDQRRSKAACQDATKLWIVKKKKDDKTAVAPKDLLTAWTMIEWAQIVIDDSPFPSLASKPSVIAVDVFSALPATLSLVIPEKTAAVAE